jgi:hypothetical protein
MDDARQGIVHVIGPEQGFTLPGTTVVCGDSHTATHGAFGALAFGIGTSEVEHVLATQTLLQRKSKNMRINVNGTLPEHTKSKDLVCSPQCSFARMQRLLSVSGFHSVAVHLWKKTSRSKLSLCNWSRCCTLSESSGPRVARAMSLNSRGMRFGLSRSKWVPLVPPLPLCHCSSELGDMLVYPFTRPFVYVLLVRRECRSVTWPSKPAPKQASLLPTKPPSK